MNLFQLLYMYKHGYIHRDVSNNNIMINHEGKVKLLDFCFAIECNLSARNFDSESGKSSSRRCQGTMGYCAPETSTRSDWLTESADAFSVVCIVFDIIAGGMHDSVCGYHDLLEDDSEIFPVDEIAFDKVSCASSKLFIVISILVHK